MAKVLVRSGRDFMPQVESGGGATVAPTVTMQETIDTEIQILNSNDLIREVIRAETPARLYPELGHTSQSSRIWRAITDFVSKIAPSGQIEGSYNQSTHLSRPSTQSLEELAAEAFAKDFGVAPVKLSNVIGISLRNADRGIATEALSRLMPDSRRDMLQHSALAAVRCWRSRLPPISLS